MLPFSKTNKNITSATLLLVSHKYTPCIQYAIYNCFKIMKKSSGDSSLRAGFLSVFQIHFIIIYIGGSKKYSYTKEDVLQMMFNLNIVLYTQYTIQSCYLTVINLY